MEYMYYSCKESEDLISAFSSISDLTDKLNYADWNISIDIIGKVNTTPDIYDEENNLIEEREPTWTDFLFNVIFITEKYKHLFMEFKVENPITPIRTFF